jgi:hypothetical protein
MAFERLLASRRERKRTLRSMISMRAVTCSTMVLLAFGDLRSTGKAAEKAAAALASEPEGSSSRRPKPPQVI